MEILTIVVPLVIVAVVIFAVRRNIRWQDPSLSSEEKQAEARLWSSRHGGGPGG